jgi:hypothetical protein
MISIVAFHFGGAIAPSASPVPPPLKWTRIPLYSEFLTYNSLFNATVYTCNVYDCALNTLCTGLQICSGEQDCTVWFGCWRDWHCVRTPGGELSSLECIPCMHIPHSMLQLAYCQHNIGWPDVRYLYYAELEHNMSTCSVGVVDRRDQSKHDL